MCFFWIVNPEMYLACNLIWFSIFVKTVLFMPMEFTGMSRKILTMGLINHSYFGGFLVKPSPTYVTFITILFQPFPKNETGNLKEMYTRKMFLMKIQLLNAQSVILTSPSYIVYNAYFLSFLILLLWILLFRWHLLLLVRVLPIFPESYKLHMKIVSAIVSPCEDDMANSLSYK